MEESFEISFVIEGEEVGLERIRQKEAERYQAAFRTMAACGASLFLDGKGISCDGACALPLADARKALAETKESYGREGMVQLLEGPIRTSDALWRDIADASPYRAGFRRAAVEVETRDISLEQFALFNQKLAKANSVGLASKIHPEHYSFEAGTGGTQTIIETFGMYGEPSYFHLKPVTDGWRPEEPDEDTVLSMAGETYLVHGQRDTKLVGFHQFKRTDGGMKVKLGAYLPAAAPDEMVSGHRWHLMIESANVLELAAQEHPNAVQRAAIGAALRHMAQSGR